MLEGEFSSDQARIAHATDRLEMVDRLNDYDYDQTFPWSRTSISLTETDYGPQEVTKTESYTLDQGYLKWLHAVINSCVVAELAADGIEQTIWKKDKDKDKPTY